MWAKSLLLAGVVMLGAAAPASARPAPQIQPNWVFGAQDRGGHQQRELRPLREIVEDLRARYGGEYVGYRLEDGARPIYVIRWRMPNGELRDFRVNAAR